MPLDPIAGPSTVVPMLRRMLWIVGAMLPVSSVLAQCEVEARVLRVTENNQQLALARFQQAAALVAQYETLAESQPILEPLIEPAKTARDQAAQVLGEAEAALTLARDDFTGCEEEAARLQEEEERVLLESVPKLALTIEYSGPVHSMAFTREEVRRFAAAMENPLLQPVTTPIEVSVSAEAGFAYQLLQSSDLVTWQTQSAATYLASDMNISWQITPTSGSRNRGDTKERGATGIAVPYFRLAISPGDTTQGGGRGRGR